MEILYINVVDSSSSKATGAEYCNNLLGNGHYCNYDSECNNGTCSGNCNGLCTPGRCKQNCTGKQWEDGYGCKWKTANNNTCKNK